MSGWNGGGVGRRLGLGVGVRVRVGVGVRKPERCERRLSPRCTWGDASFGRARGLDGVEAWFWSHDAEHRGSRSHAERGNENSPPHEHDTVGVRPPLARGCCFVTIGGEGGDGGDLRRRGGVRGLRNEPGDPAHTGFCETNPTSEDGWVLRNEPYDRGARGFCETNPTSGAVSEVCETNPATGGPCGLRNEPSDRAREVCETNSAMRGRVSSEAV